MKLTGNNQFDRFYAAYPRHTAQKAAIKAWDKAVKGEDPEEFTKKVILAIDAQKRERKQKEKNGVWMPDWPMPATWLNQGRWDDEIDSTETIEREAKKYVCECGQEGKYAAEGNRWCARCFTNKFTPAIQQIKDGMPEEMRKLKTEPFADYYSKNKNHCLRKLYVKA